MARIDKKFVLSTSQLNSHGFRCLTEGCDMTDFIGNPVMYWLHQAPEGKSNNEPMPTGFWETLQKEGDDITGYPNIDDSDEFAAKLGKKIEHGTIRAASVEVIPLAFDTNKANWLPGQKYPTVTKWKIGEASIVDRGSNPGAIVKLKYNGKSILLSDQASADDFFNTLQKPAEDKMKITLNKKASKALKLSEGAELDATEVVDKLVEVIEEKEAKVTELDGEIVTLKKAATTEKITLMVDKAVGERKILAGEKEGYIKLAEADFETTKALLDAKKGSQSVQNALDGKTGEDNTGEVGKLMKLSYNELFGGEGLTKLKALDPESYKLKFKEHHGYLPGEKK